MDKKLLVTRSSMPPYEEFAEAIKPLWDTHWLTNMGVYHKELEEQLKRYLDVDFISLMVNGHMALEMTIQAFDFPPGSEIITTPFTFISTTHAIARNGLVPVFCDVKMSDGTIDENKIESLITEKTVAIVPVHVYGNICNVEKIQEIASKYNLKVIYDAAHSFGEKHIDKGIGNYGDASVFSFHATKVFNTIEGGAVTFKNSSLYEKLYNLKNFGIKNEEVVEAIGANAKMNEFSAIMGLCNLKRIDRVIEIRRQKWEYYAKNISNIGGIDILLASSTDTKNYAYFPVVVRDEFGVTRDELYMRLKEKNIFSRKYFYPLTCTHKCYEEYSKGCTCGNAFYLSGRVLTLPFYEEIDYDSMDHVIDSIIEIKRNSTS